jgi:hypothetical protein
MHLHVLSQKIDRHLIGGLFSRRKYIPRRPYQRFLPFDQLADHFFRLEHTVGFGDGGPTATAFGAAVFMVRTPSAYGHVGRGSTRAFIS